MATFSGSNGFITIFLDSGEQVFMKPGDINYEDVMSALKDNNIDLAAEIAEETVEEKSNRVYSSSGVEFKGNNLFIDGQIQHTDIARRVKEHAAQGLPLDHLLKFVEKLEKNPSMRSRMQLFKFLDSQHMAIDQDGDIIGYKAVRNDWTDKHSGKILNTIGSTVEMKRELVDDDPASPCSRGLHSGNLEYVKNFAGVGDRIILVKINPKDVVSVPQHDCRKLRCCKYVVISEFERELSEQVYGLDEGKFYSWEYDEMWEVGDM